MTGPAHRLILLPGLGADARMWHPQVSAIPGLETPDWIPHEPRESLRHYAMRIAEGLRIREPATIGGISFGGMLALEIAPLVPVRSVIQIASCRHPSAVNSLLLVCELVARPVPDAALRLGMPLAPLFLGRGGALLPPDRRLLVQMVRGLPVPFIKWAARAIREWEGCEDPGVPVHHIHGDRDWVIPLAGVQPERTISGGLHVLNLSHPAEVNAFIRNCAGA